MYVYVCIYIYIAYDDICRTIAIHNYIHICGTGFWGLFRSPGYIRPPGILQAPPSIEPKSTYIELILRHSELWWRWKAKKSFDGKRTQLKPSEPNFKPSDKNKCHLCYIIT